MQRTIGCFEAGVNLEDCGRLSGKKGRKMVAIVVVILV